MFLLTTLLSLSTAHNWMSSPRPWNTLWHTNGCRGSQCTNACPDVKIPSEMGSSLSSPGAWVRRGGQLKVSWVRNQHFGGMFRVSLVPLPYCMDRSAHQRLSIEYGCFESGSYSCRSEGDDCGTDKKEAFKRWIEIPTVFPDGDYCMGYVWFGGLHFKRKYGGFADYYSCSIVKVRGGKKLGGWHVPRFVAGKGRDSKGVRNGKCLTSSTYVGKCDKGACSRDRATLSSPAYVKKNPSAITVNTVKGYFDERGGDQNLFKGICKSGVCCHKQCGRCSGSRCNRLPGGSDNCCASTIKKSGRSCKKYEPPCIVD